MSTPSAASDISAFETPAKERLSWILAAIESADATPEADVEERFTESMLATWPAATLVAGLKSLTAVGPFEPMALELYEGRARARLRTRTGDLAIIDCSVELSAPHRVTHLAMTIDNARDVAPPLPDDFTTYEGPVRIGNPSTASPPKIIVMAGVPATGKSSVADLVGAALGTPVFSGDWVAGAFTPFGGRGFGQLIPMVTEQVVSLVIRQLLLGQSAIVDLAVDDVALRDRWKSLADRFSASLLVVHCTCSDETLHRDRFVNRKKVVPGWHATGDWRNVKRRLQAFQPWPNAIELDSARLSIDDMVARVLHEAGPAKGVTPAGL